MIHCDSAYLLKFYIPEPGSAEVRALLENHDAAACCHAQVEVVSAVHRKWRAGLISASAGSLSSPARRCLELRLESN
jgi:predicted nucleic acid-binding protein